MNFFFLGKVSSKFSKDGPTPSQLVQKLNVKCVEARRPPRSRTTPAVQQWECSYKDSFLCSKLHYFDSTVLLRYTDSFFEIRTEFSQIFYLDPYLHYLLMNIFIIYYLFSDTLFSFFTSFKSVFKFFIVLYKHRFYLDLFFIIRTIPY